MKKTLLIIFLTNLFANIITGNEGSTVAIVYNSKLQESKSVADYYAKSRSVPEKNLIGLPCLLYTSPSPRDATLSRMPSSA